jgi:ATP synthase protein I
MSLAKEGRKAMKNGPGNSGRRSRDEFSRKIEEKEKRKIRGRKEKDQSVWFGLGMFGLIGWGVAIPTLIGIAIGIWLDATFQSRYSWTLMCLIIGLAIGCLNGWHWLKKEGRRG